MGKTNLAAVPARARSAAVKAAASRVATASAVLFGVGAIGLGVVLIFTDLLPSSGTGTGVGAAVGGLTVLLTMAYGVREMRNAKKAEEKRRTLNRFGRRAWRTPIVPSGDEQLQQPERDTGGVALNLRGSLPTSGKTRPATSGPSSIRRTRRDKYPGSDLPVCRWRS